ncbi:MAG: hypothetical protein Q9M13_00135, partial [Mariprofundales bacterium]|nr:hypothetical protein [Mariprofundales bacterium]
EGGVQPRRRAAPLLWLSLLGLVVAGGVLWIPNPWQGRAHDALAVAQSWWMPIVVRQPARSSHSTPESVPPVAEMVVADLAYGAGAVHHEVGAGEVVVPASESERGQVNIEQGDVAQGAAADSSSAAERQPADERQSAAVEQATGEQMVALHRQLQGIVTSQQQLAQRQHLLAAGSLRQQIAQLIAPGTSLSQIVQGWRGVLASSLLGAESRRHAEEIVAEAERLLVQRQQWQQLLRHAADQLHGEVDGADRQYVALHDIVAIADLPFVHWLDRQFTLYRLPGIEQQHKSRLATQLQQTALLMEHEQLPTATRWRAVRQQLAYWLEPEQVASLPKDFVAFGRRVQQLQQRQLAWLEEVK